VEVWDSEGFYLNKFLCYNSIPLADIVDGAMQHTIQCYPYDDKMQPGKLQCTINMKVNLAEIWDYNIEFMDWKTSSLENTEKPMQISSYLDIDMYSNQALRSNVRSAIQKNTFLPYWAKIEGGILFRGTYHELKA
jgi:hypothetical protein